MDPVNAMAPGTIDTEFAAGVMDPAARRASLERRARERISLTSHVLLVDGGIFAQ
jgi:hypothetical protein